ncbi:MAG: hypothetical protein IPH12_21500 [Saprospirales bacterium]|nr:hypothetical protein [Saprospirales bacterium]
MAPVFRLHFTALESGALLSEALWLDAATLPALAYRSSLAETPVDLVFEAYTGAEAASPADGFALLANRPNPFSGTTTLGFVLPEACTARLRMFDDAGREWWRLEKDYPAGYSAELLRLEETPPPACCSANCSRRSGSCFGRWRFLKIEDWGGCLLKFWGRLPGAN